MKLMCVGTGSKGNSYVLTNGQESLILDCGIRFWDVKKAMNFNIRGIRGALVSHTHGDHAAYIHDYQMSGIPVFQPYTMESLRQDAQFGGFRVQSFGVIHDVPCCGFLIHHKDFGKMLYATDTAYIKYVFKGLSTMLIEANYDERYVDNTQAKYRHVLTGHMSLQTTMECIRANSSQELRHVILCHLSESNGNPVEFREEVSKIVPPGCTVDIAEQGRSVEL